MKTTVIYALCMFVAAFAFGQKQDLNEIKVTAPVFGSEFYESLDDLLIAATEYPADAKKFGKQGTVVIGFTVTDEGKTENFEIVNSVYSSLDNEVIRILAITDGKWKPGTVDGEPADMYKEISVVFQAQKNADFIALAREYITIGNELLFYSNNPQKASRYFDKGITLLPKEEALLTSRSLCRYMMGNIDGARQDWNRIKLLSQTNEVRNNLELAENYKSLEGYKEMLAALSK